MEHFRELERARGIVSVHLHEIGHMIPPTAADRRLRDCAPSSLILNLSVRNELARSSVEKDRIVMNAMSLRVCSNSCQIGL